MKEIGEICITFSGGTPSRSKKSYYGQGYPWIKSGELNQKKVFNTKEQITKVAIDESSARLVEPGTNLVALYGATAGVVGRSMIKAAINQAVLAVIPKSTNEIDNSYLFYALDYYMPQSLRNLQGAQPNLSGTIVKKIKLPVYQLSEQKKIAEILGACDEAIEVQQKLIELKEKRLKGWMQKLLNFDVRFPEFKDEALMEIPIGDAFKFLKISSIARDGLSESGEVSYLHYGDIHNSDRNFWSSGCFLKNKAHAEKVEGVTRLQGGDIVIVDASEDYDDVAKCVEIENLENIEAVAGLHTFLMRANPEILAPRFRSFALKENSVRKACKKLSTGISVLGLSKTNLSKVRLKVSTNLKEQKAIGDFLFELNREVILEKEKLTQLKRQKRGLMQKLLSGEVPVKFDDTMEDSI